MGEYEGCERSAGLRPVAYYDGIMRSHAPAHTRTCAHYVIITGLI